MVMEVFALIGASGTGKSHRASVVAADRGIDVILDDGLLVMDGRIVAGRSAKREDTMVAAVKRAILDDPAHAYDIRRALDEIRPERLLILGTSQHMVKRVMKTLGLDSAPLSIIPIETVADAAEIAMARTIRRQQGKHVIPAPTFEVRKTFSGYLVDPLRSIVRGKEQRRVVEKSVVRPTYSSLGRFYIADTVLASIAAWAAGGIPGVGRVLKCTMTPWPDGVECHLDVALLRGFVIPEALRLVQEAVKEQVEYQTALNVLGVHVTARRLMADLSTRREEQWDLKS